MANVTDPKTIAVANLEPDTKVATPPADDKSLSFLNEENEFDAAPSKPKQDEPAKQPEAPVAVQAPVAPVPSAHPASLIAHARALGINESYLAPGAVPSEVLIDWVVTTQRDRAALEAAQKYPAAQQAAPVVAEDDYDEALIAGIEKEITGIDERIPKHFRNQSQRVKSQAKHIETLTKKLEAMEQREVERENRQFNEGIEAAIAVLPGKASYASQEAKTSLFLAARIQKGDSPAVIAQKIAAADKQFREMFGPAAPAPTAPPPPANGKHPVSQSAEEFRAAVLAKPGGGMSKREKTIHQAVREKMLEFAQSGQPDDDDDFPGVPDR